VYGWSVSQTKTTTSTSTEKPAVPVKVTLTNPELFPRYEANGKGPEFPLFDDERFCMTKAQKGGYWRAKFKGGAQWI